LATPYAYIYDAPVLLAGSAFLVRDCLDRGFRPYDSVLLCLCCLLPGLFHFAGSVTAPVVCLLLLVLALRRAGGPPKFGGKPRRED
jgi:hypothetical protein